VEIPSSPSVMNHWFSGYDRKEFHAHLMKEHIRVRNYKMSDRELGMREISCRWKPTLSCVSECRAGLAPLDSALDIVANIPLSQN
jgi:hypothetical protein